MSKFFQHQLIILLILVTYVVGFTANAIQPELELELYQAALNTTPDQQDWKRFYYSDSNNSSEQADVSVSNNVLSFDTLTNNTLNLVDGYFTQSPIVTELNLSLLESFSDQLPANLADNLENLRKPDHPQAPLLDRNSGFVVRFSLRIVAETHAARDDNGDQIDDRAGFSLIVVSSDLAAIEIGFWDNEVWVYEAPAGSTGNFTHAEGQTFNTSNTLLTYELTIQGDNYTLTASNPSSSDLLLTGALRDYSVWGGVDLLETIDLSGISNPFILALLPDNIIVQPYQIPNLVFFGDNTGSAQAQIELMSLSIDSLPTPDSVIFNDHFELTQNRQ